MSFPGLSLWPDQPTAILDVRRSINDGPKDRHVKDKRVLGPADGVNTNFFTLEDRLVLTAAGSLLPAPGIIVSIDFVPIPQNQITINTDPVLGSFSLATPPIATADVRVEYFFQYFLDEDLDEALRMAAGQILSVTNYLLIAPGLQLAALYLSAHFAFQKQAVRWVDRLSHKFILEDEPLQNEVMNRSNLFQSLANVYWKRGLEARDDFYTRQGRRNAPAFARYAPRIGPTGPVR